MKFSEKALPTLLCGGAILFVLGHGLLSSDESPVNRFPPDLLHEPVADEPQSVEKDPDGTPDADPAKPSPEKRSDEESRPIAITTGMLLPGVDLEAQPPTAPKEPAPPAPSQPTPTKADRTAASIEPPPAFEELFPTETPTPADEAPAPQKAREPEPPTSEKTPVDPAPPPPSADSPAARSSSLQSILEQGRGDKPPPTTGDRPNFLPVVEIREESEPVADLFPTVVEAPEEDRPDPPITEPADASTERGELPERPTFGTGPREPIPGETDELVFPLTLEIPGFDPGESIVTETGIVLPPEQTAGAADDPNRSTAPPPEIPPTDPSLYYAAPFSVGVGATLGDNSDVYVDALVPFWQTGGDSYRTLLFLAPRLTGTEEETNSASLGLGFRSLRGHGSFLGSHFPWIIGGNVFYDFTRSSNDFDYNQFGAGLEWMSPYLDLRFNAYFPDKDKNQIAETSSSNTSTSTSTTTQTSYSAPFAVGHTIVQPFTTTTTRLFRRTTTTRFFEKYEAALEGYDGEAGILLPTELTYIPVRIYGGYYAFDNPYGEDIAGPKARLEARPFSFLLLDASWYDDEDLLGSEWFLGARADITIGGGPGVPSSSKPLHDTAEGPKTEAYNPWGNFNRRLVERIPRNYRAVLVETPFIENEARRRVRTSSSSSTSTESGTDMIATDLIFVDAARGADATAGTWENPRNTIQGGADRAVAKFRSTGRVWTVWTQGGVGPYNEEVTVTDSVRFASSSVPIQANGGLVFGGALHGPIVNGGFLFGSLPASAASPTIDTASIRGYQIRGGHSGASMAAVTFVNVRNADFSGNRIGPVDGNGIQVYQRGTVSGTGTFTQNGIFNTVGDAVNFDFADEASGSYALSNSVIEVIPGNVVRVNATDQSTYKISIVGSSASGLADSAIYLEGDSDSNGTLSVRNSSFDAGGVETTLSGNAVNTLNVSGTSFTNDPDAVFDLSLSDSARQVATIQNNVLNNNRSGFGLSVTGTALSDTTFRGNSVSNSNTGDAVVADFSSAALGSQSFAASGNEISNTDGSGIFINATAGRLIATLENNTIDLSTGHGFHIRSAGLANVTATVSGNGTTNTSDGAALLRTAGTGNLTATVENNVFANSGTYGVRLRSVNGGAISAEVTGNTFRQTVSAALDLITRDNAILAVLAQSNVVRDSNAFGFVTDAADSSILNLFATSNNIQETTDEGILFTGGDNSSSRFEARGNLIASTGNAPGIRSSSLGSHSLTLVAANNIIGPVAQQAVVVETSDTTTADIEISGNTLTDSAQDTIRMNLFSTENQSAQISGNRLQRVGSNAINVSTQGPKTVSVYNNDIGNTGAAAVRVDMQSGGLTLEGADTGNNIYTDLTPVPFNDDGTAPFTGGVGVRINGTVYP